MVNLPARLLTPSELEQREPKLRGIMKIHSRSRFEQIGVIIISQPQTRPNHQVYGLFVVDKRAVAWNLENPGQQPRPQVKQDFLVHDSESGNVKYYRGLLQGEVPTEILRPLREFNETYGCGGLYYATYRRSGGGVWLTDHHQYLDENDEHLPTEQWIRDAVKEALNRVRKEILAATV